MVGWSTIILLGLLFLALIVIPYIVLIKTEKPIPLRHRSMTVEDIRDLNEMNNKKKKVKIPKGKVLPFKNKPHYNNNFNKRR